MNPCHDYLNHLTRRQFFAGAGLAMGGVALNWLAPRLRAAPAPGTLIHPPMPGFPHFAPKAKRVIYLHMNGGPSQLDTFDYKPGLQEHYDVELPGSIRMGQRITTMTSGQARFPVAPSLFKWAQHGKSGAWVSELLPWTAKLVDDLAIVRSVHTNAINHDPACTFLMTGSEIPGKGSLGSWISYGLGSENNDLPAFVVLTPKWSSKAQAQALFTRMWSSGFLPGSHNGVACGRRATRCSSSKIPTAWIRPPAARCSTRSRSSTTSRTRVPATRKPSRASPSTKWRFACRPACRT